MATNYQATYGSTTIPSELVLKAWAKKTWDFGKKESYFSKFMGTGADSIIQVHEDLTRGKGTSIEVSLLMPLNGAGVIEDKWLEGNEEQLNYRSCEVRLSRIRNAVVLEGRFEEQKTQEKMRSDSRTSLSSWLGRYVDLSIFAVATGTTPNLAPAPNATTLELPYTIEPPTPDRVLYAGNATTEASITPADVFDTTLIGKAKRMARADELTAVKPIRIEGRDTYVMVIDPYQARDLKKDPRWIEAQQYANVRGTNNPIFTGALGMYDGVVIHECDRVPRTKTGSNNAYVGHSLFLGAQAFIFAEGEAPKWEEKTFDYGNRYGVSLSRMFGLKRAQFKYDGINLTDFGCINVMTSSEGD